jgi:hypothetical protein
MKYSYKVCHHCHKRLRTTNFYKNNKTRDGFYWQCKKCQLDYAKVYRRKNHVKVRKQIHDCRLRLRRERMLFVLLYLREHPCVDCGETDPICLDFDHVKGQKLNGISYMISDCRSYKNIKKEIAKCEVRCANCHRRKTMQEMNYYSYIDFETMTIRT